MSVEVTIPDADPDIALIEAGDDACLINAGPPGSNVAPALVRGLDAGTSLSSVVATDADEAHLGAFPDVLAAADGGVTCSVGQGEDPPDCVTRALDNGSGKVRRAERGDPIYVGRRDGMVVPLTDPSREDHPDTTALDLRFWDGDFGAYTPDNVVFTGDLAPGEGRAVADAASEVYDHRASVRDVEPESGILPGKSNQVFVDSDRARAGTTPEWSATVLDHRGCEGVSNLLTTETEHVLTDASGRALVDAADENGATVGETTRNGRLVVEMGWRGVDLSAAVGTLGDSIVPESPSLTEDRSESDRGPSPF